MPPELIKAYTELGEKYMATVTFVHDSACFDGVPLGMVKDLEVAVTRISNEFWKKYLDKIQWF